MRSGINAKNVDTAGKWPLLAIRTGFRDRDMAWARVEALFAVNPAVDRAAAQIERGAVQRLCRPGVDPAAQGVDRMYEYKALAAAPVSG
jgi:hypothetical protein